MVAFNNLKIGWKLAIMNFGRWHQWQNFLKSTTQFYSSCHNYNHFKRL